MTVFYDKLNSKKSEILERFLKYVKIWTTSDSQSADSGNQPSTERQFEFAKALKSEMESLGFENTQITKHCYLYGVLPASPGAESEKPVCLLAHLDTVEEVSGENVNPQIHENYAGQKIMLSNGAELSPENDADLAFSAKNRETIVTTDGNTLLGADDKAGICAIMTATEFFASNKDVKHGKIEVIFSPDEETGHGMDNVPLDLIESKSAYTVDGGHIGELETECFNAYKSEIKFTGKSKHTGTARPDMVNAITMASSFVSNLPRQEAPETTDCYQGFYAPMNIEGSIEEAKVTVFLRDFSEEGMEKRKKFIDSLADVTAMSFGGNVKVIHTFQYANMRKKLDENKKIVEKLVSAYKDSAVEPKFIPIRGGTDGSRLTELGIPTPNIFTGGHNYHSRTEWLSVNQMMKSAEILINLCKI